MDEMTGTCGTDSGYQRHLAASEKTCEACRVAHAVYNKEQKRKVGSAQINRTVNLASNYGITPEEYDSMLSWQNGVCAVCRLPESVSRTDGKGVRQLCVDHDHATGALRGLLCSRCNSAEGLLASDPKRAQRLMEYLHTYDKTTGRIYICGPMTGYPRQNVPAFDLARDRLLAEDWNVVSPVDLDREHGHNPELAPDAVGVTEAMRRDILALTTCSHIYCLIGHEGSKGAAIEQRTARSMGLGFLYEQRHLSQVVKSAMRKEAMEVV